MPSLQELETKFNNHQHRGYDNSQILSLLDWKELKRSELAVAATSLTLLDIPRKRFLRVFIQFNDKSGASNNLLRFNNDSGSNYTYIDEINATARTSQTSFDLTDTANSALPYFVVIDIVNVANQEKAINSVAVRRIASASTAQTRTRLSGTWVNIADAITRIDLVSSGAATFPAQTQMVVYGSSFS